MSLPRLGIEIGASVIKVIWLSQAGELKSIETIPLPVDKKSGEISYPPDLTLKRIGSIPDRFRFQGDWEAALATDGSFFLLWDKKTGETVTPLLSWRDTRGSRWVSKMNQKQRESIREKTGLPPDPRRPLTKLKHYSGQSQVKKLSESNRLCFGSLSTWLLWIASGQEFHWMDSTQALRTGMFNPDQSDWANELLAELNLPTSALPETSATLPDKVSASEIWENSTIVSVLARQEANTIGSQPPPYSRTSARFGAATTISAPKPEGNNTELKNFPVTYTPAKREKESRVEGNIPTGRNTVDWLTKILGINRRTFELWVAPPWPEDPPLWLTGGETESPLNKNHLTGCFNFNETTSTKEICQGLMISLLLQTNQILNRFADSGIETGVTVTGELALSTDLPALAAAVWDVPTTVIDTPHLTARGALIYSDWQFSYLQSDPWEDLIQEVVLPEKKVDADNWKANWEELT